MKKRGGRARSAKKNPRRKLPATRRAADKGKARKPRTARRAPDLADDEAFARVLQSIDTMTQRASAASQRSIERLLREHEPSRIGKARREADLALARSSSARLLAQDLRIVLDDAKAAVSIAEANASLGILTALARHHDRIRAAAPAPAKRPSLGPRRPAPPVAKSTSTGPRHPAPSGSRTGAGEDLSVAFDEAKHAVAIVIADRNRMRAALDALERQPDAGGEAQRLRRELAVQEAAVETLMEGLRMIYAAMESST